MSDLEARLTQISVDPDRPSVFVMSIAMAKLAPEVIARVNANWRAIWLRAGRAKPPELVLLSEGQTLECLTDHELRDHGLMRIPPEARDDGS